MSLTTHTPTSPLPLCPLSLQGAFTRNISDRMEGVGREKWKTLESLSFSPGRFEEFFPRRGRLPRTGLPTEGRKRGAVLFLVDLFLLASVAQKNVPGDRPSVASLPLLRHLMERERSVPKRKEAEG